MPQAELNPQALSPAGPQHRTTQQGLPSCFAIANTPCVRASGCRALFAEPVPFEHHSRRSRRNQSPCIPWDPVCRCVSQPQARPVALRMLTPVHDCPPTGTAPPCSTRSCSFRTSSPSLSCGRTRRRRRCTTSGWSTGTPWPPSCEAPGTAPALLRIALQHQQPSSSSQVPAARYQQPRSSSNTYSRTCNCSSSSSNLLSPSAHPEAAQCPASLQQPL